MTPRRRCQPSSGATRAELVFPAKGEGPARRCRRHAMAIEVLVPPCADRVAIRIVTRATTVYTNAPKRHREAILANLCTLLRPHRLLARSSRRNSVHKRSNPVRRGPILPFVYTIAIPRPPTTQAHGATVYTNAPKRRRGAIFVDLCTLLRPRVCPQQRNSPTVYTNAPIRCGEARSSHLCTLLRSQGHPQPKPTAQQCTQMPQNGAEGAISTDLCTLCVVTLAVRPTPSWR